MRVIIFMSTILLAKAINPELNLYGGNDDVVAWVILYAISFDFLSVLPSSRR